MLANSHVELTDLLVGFILNRMFDNYKIEAGNLAEADPSIISGDAFIDYFNYLIVEVDNLPDVNEYRSSPVFIRLEEYTRAKLKRDLTKTTMINIDKEESFNQDTVIGKLFPVVVTNVDIPDDTLDELVKQIIPLLLSSLKHRSVHLNMLYEPYLIMATQLIETMPRARKLDRIYLSICCQWSDDTVSSYLSTVDIKEEKSFFKAMAILINTTSRELTEDLLHGAISIATKGKSSGKVTAYKYVAKKDLDPVMDFLDNYGNERPDLSHVIDVLKGYVATQVKL